MPPQLFARRLSGVHTQTCSHQYAGAAVGVPRDSQEARPCPGGSVMGAVSAQLSFGSPSLACLRGSRGTSPVTVPPFLFRRGSGEGGKGAVFRMCYLLPQTGGEEPAPPFPCGILVGQDPCRTCRDGAGRAAGHSYSQHPLAPGLCRYCHLLAEASSCQTETREF